MDEIDRDRRMNELRLRRLDLERNCTDPQEWQRLAEDYDTIGAWTNAATCRRRAIVYRTKSEAVHV